MKRLTLVVACDRESARDQVAHLLSARNYRVLFTDMGPSTLLALAEAEPHDIGIVIPETATAVAEYKGYREAVGPKGVKVVVVGPNDAAKAAAEAAKDRYLPALERDSLIHAIELAARHLSTILVADDEPLIRKMFSMFLTGQGYKVVTAEDGDDAIEKVKSVLPDLVITDIKMPHKDGYELCRAIKESKNTQHIPVIIVSALGGELDVDRGFNAGANEYVTKPVDLNDLGQRIQNIFRGIAMRGREKVLVAVRSQIERSALDYGLAQQGFEVVVAPDPEEAFEAARRDKPGVIVADYDLGAGGPALIGAGAGAGAGAPAPQGAPPDVFGFREKLRADRTTRDLPFVVLLGRNSKLDAHRRERLDAAAFVAKPYSAERLVAQIERILGERRLRIEVERDFLLQAIMMIVTALEARDKYTRGHSENVARYSMMIAQHIYETEEERARLHLSARLHDIGKIGVPDAVLLKPGKLTPEEWEKMKAHPMEGVRILSPIPSLQDIIPGVRWHHERMDGKGYPDGLTAPDIPLQARIISVGDTFDALTSHRPYRRGMPIEKAISILNEAAGPQLDPALVEIFVREVQETRLKIPELDAEPASAATPARASAAT